MADTVVKMEDKDFAGLREPKVEENPFELGEGSHNLAISSEAMAQSSAQTAQALQVCEPTDGAEPSEHRKQKRKRNGKPITEKWRPVYQWLEGLKQKEVVKGSDITEWLDAHNELRQRLLQNHKPEHIFNYIQKCHARMISDPRVRTLSAKVHAVQGDQTVQGDQAVQGDGAVLLEDVSEGRLKRSNSKPSPTDPNNAAPLPITAVKKTRKRRKWGTVHTGPARHLRVRVKRPEPPPPPPPPPPPNATVKKTRGRRKAAPREIPATEPSSTMPAYHWNAGELQRRLEAALAVQSGAMNLVESFRVHRGDGFEDLNILDQISDAAPLSVRAASDGIFVNGFGVPATGYGERPIWSNRHAANGIVASIVRGNDLERRARKPGILSWAFNDAEPDLQEPSPNILACLANRERGENSGRQAFRPHDVGNRGLRWTAHVEGWNTLGRQASGPVAYLERQYYRAWGASWCAYTSNAAAAPTGGVDGVQKVLDLRFNPAGLPQLVCSCNAAPSELLLYNLVNGRARELAGHDCQIQAVEYALDGARIVSCGANVIKVWDAFAGSCLFTMGEVGGAEDGIGHKKKISAMAVNQRQSCLVATSGGDGATEILLWNIRNGEIASDLNAELRHHAANVQSMDALLFVSHNLLVCGSDAAGDQPAVVQMWDTESTKHLMTFPACDSYITCLGADPTGATIIAGAGDATVGLFDVRTGGAICRLPLGVESEVTTTGFSACGNYFHASGTGNHTLVWDIRMMSMDPGPMPVGKPIPVSRPQIRSMRPLHCLNHGEPMPTTQNAGQLPGFVDEGDGGVNDARWFRNAPLLVTASGNSSVAIWDVSLGRPCLKVFRSHSRCINTVAVSPDDQIIASGGDDQKVVLYQSSQNESVRGWRLTHPLSDGATTDHVRQQLDDVL